LQLFFFWPAGSLWLILEEQTATDVTVTQKLELHIAIEVTV
jgi:hypothetical protein